LYKDNNTTRRSTVTGVSSNGDLSTAAVFEKEAQALQEELENMQKILHERMKRYQSLSPKE
jgi:ribosome-binding factor A